MFVAHLVVAEEKAITVMISDGLTVNVPVHSAVPAFTTPLQGGDIYSLYDQESFFWKYRLYKKLDLNRDGRVDYYILVEAFFGPHAGDVDILVDGTKRSWSLLTRLPYHNRGSRFLMARQVRTTARFFTR